MMLRPPVLYIAGPMSGWPDQNFPAFEKAERHLTYLGYIVSNPAALAKGHTQEWYRREGVLTVCAADGIATLSGWEGSVGATLEVLVAQRIGIPVRPLYAWERASD